MMDLHVQLTAEVYHQPRPDWLPTSEMKQEAKAIRSFRLLPSWVSSQRLLVESLEIVLRCRVPEAQEHIHLWPPQETKARR